MQFQGYSWQSVSAAALCLKCDRKTIRNLVNATVFTVISEEEFFSFSGEQIFNDTAETTFTADPEGFDRLKEAIKTERLRLRTLPSS
jgi:hypothetical protein